MLDWLRKLFRPDAKMAAACTAHDAGDWARAVALLEPLAREHPGNASLLYRLGDALYQLDRIQEALPRLERAVQLAGAVPAHHYKLGNVLKDLGLPEQALARYRHTLELDPRHAPALTNTGVVLESLGRFDEAENHYRRAIAADPALLPARRNLATLLNGAERYEEAAVAYRELLEVSPDSAADWGNLGDALKARHRLDEALAAYERALALDPSMPGLLNNIGTTYRRKQSLETACRYFERAIEAAPDYTIARVNLAAAQLSLGLVEEAASGFRKVLEIEPRNEHAARHVLMSLLYARADANELFGEHLAFGRRFGSGTRPSLASSRPAPAGRKLRIGYVSSDLTSHPVGYNVLPFIERHDRETFEIFLYPSIAQPDHMTRRFSQRAAWRPIARLSDAAAAQVIRDDEVDILVLLAGRFDANRPLIATWRPAPIQVSMHDPATSGLAEMDYLIADRNLVPRHTTERFTERVACLPTFFLHPPLDEAPPPAAPPCARDGTITFGSFNNPAKVGAGVVALWAKVLHAVPGSRLLLKYREVFSIPGVRARYLEWFRRHGIGEERLIFPDQSTEARAQHLARYGEMDIALDPFPFTGSTTTFEALWMGVPVVTLEGSRMVARWSTAMLRKAGLSHLVARDEAQYVEIARALAADPAELARLRAGLRERVARSPLCAEEARTRQLERLYRRMWAIHVTRLESRVTSQESPAERPSSQRR